MLLLRHTIVIARNEQDTTDIPITVSLYRPKVDPSYQWMAWTYAESGYFDGLFLEIMLDVANNGRLILMRTIRFVYPFILGQRNIEYVTGTQNWLETLGEASCDTQEAAGMLGKPKKARLTSYVTHHFLDLYF